VKDKIKAYFSALTPAAFFVKLAAGLMVINFFVILLAGNSIKQNRKHHEERAAITSQKLSRVLNDYLCNTIDMIETRPYTRKFFI
jgi:hypothetical protein